MSYYISKCEEYKYNTKKLWQIINQTIDKKKHKGSIIPFISVDSIRTFDPQQIANSFGSFYTNLGKDLANKIVPSHTAIDEFLGKIPRTLNNLVLHLTNQLEVEKLIKNLPNKSSSGHDKVSNTLLKGLSSSISYPLTIIFNQSISQGIFLDIMKVAEVILLYKGKETDKVVNYHPISLLMTISKVPEKIVYARVYGFLETNGILYESQYGFRNKQSCKQAITKLLGHILQAKEVGHSSASIFLDLSNAFDTLNHKVLLKKLNHYGIRGIN